MTREGAYENPLRFELPNNNSLILAVHAHVHRAGYSESSEYQRQSSPYLDRSYCTSRIKYAQIGHAWDFARL